jgi:hypothetical protein
VSAEERGRLTAADIPLPGGDFQLFVSRLALQGMLALGMMENPLTRRRDVHLGNARTMLRDLELLREKTAGNLTPAEAQHLERVLAVLGHNYELESAQRTAD